MAHSGISSTNISDTGWVLLSIVLLAGLLSAAGMHNVQLDLHIGGLYIATAAKKAVGQHDQFAV